jgi:hypothetical protein
MPGPPGGIFGRREAFSVESDVPGAQPFGEADPRRPVRVEIIAYAPTVFYHCQHCELVWQHAGFGDVVRREEARQSLPPDLRDEFQRISNWVHSLWMRYGQRIRVHVVDAASLEGVWKSFRHGVRRYPAIVVDREPAHIGADFAAVEPVIERHVATADRI